MRIIFLLLLSSTAFGQYVLYPLKPATNAVTNDNTGLTVGMKFTVNKTGYIDSVGFYKATGNKAAHTGGLWSAAGVLLATVLFTETASGWQWAKITPVQVFSGFDYWVGVYNPVGYYTGELDYFTTVHGDGHLIGLNSGYAEGAGMAMPATNYRNSNYWVDVHYNMAPGSTIVRDTLQAIINVDFNNMTKRDSVAVAGTYRALFPGDRVYDTTYLRRPFTLPYLHRIIMSSTLRYVLYKEGWTTETLSGNVWKVTEVKP